MIEEGGGGEGWKGEQRTGDVEEEQRSFLETGADGDVGDVGRSSKKDLFPHTIADIVQALQLPVYLSIQSNYEKEKNFTIVRL